MSKSNTWAAKRQKRTGESGFTLLELLVVLIILALLATIAAPQVLNYLGGARTDTARIQITSLGTALDLYRLDVGQYPSTDQGLQALLDRPQSAERWKGPYIKKKDALTDPWNVPYVYRSPGQHGPYDLYTLGADKTEGGEDENEDVVSW